MRFLLAAALLLLPFAAQAAGVPATGCPTRAPADGGTQRNLPCCTDPAYDPAVDGVRCLGPVSRYEMTMEKFGFLRDDGQKFMFGSPQVFNIASATAGADVGAFASNVVLPAGHYIATIPYIGTFAQASVNIRIANGRRCTLNGPIKIIDKDPPPGACAADEPNDATHVCTSGSYTHFIDDGGINVNYDPARGMSVAFGFYLDNGAVCDFSGAGDVTATYFDMPVVINVTSN